MRAYLIIIFQVRQQYVTEVPLSEHNNVVNAFPSDRTPSSTLVSLAAGQAGKLPWSDAWSGMIGTLDGPRNGRSTGPAGRTAGVPNGSIGFGLDGLLSGS